MHSEDYAVARCLSVRLSVTRRYSVETAKQIYTLEMCMGMGFPMGTGIPWESHGNGNKTQNWE